MSRPSDSTRADARTITISVTFFADLRRFLPRGAEGPQRYTVLEGATAADLLAAIGVEAGAEVTIAVDGELASRETPLRDGDDVMLLNPMEGGAAAEGEATIQDIGGAAARWRSRSRRRGDAMQKRARRACNQRLSSSRTDWNASAYFTRAWMPRKLAVDRASSRIVRSSMFVFETCER